MNKFRYLIAVTSVLALLLPGCAEDEVKPTANNDTPAPVIGSLNPVSGYIGDVVEINGSNFGSDISKSEITFNGIKVTDIISYQDSKASVKVPANATTGEVIITVNGKKSNGVAFEVKNKYEFAGYFPYHTGNWWKYENYNTDSTGSQKGNATFDSTVAMGEIIYGGKLSVMMVSYKTGANQSTDTSFIAIENGQAFAYIKAGPGIPEQWVLLADSSRNQWDIGSYTLTDYYTDTTKNFKLNGTITLKASKGNTKDTTILGKQTNMVEYLQNMEFIGTVTPKTPPVQLPVKMTIVRHFWFAYGIGMVLQTGDPIPIEITGLGKMYQDGMISAIINYKIK